MSLQHVDKKKRGYLQAPGRLGKRGRMHPADAIPVKLRNRALAPRNRSAAEHQSFAWLRGRLPEYNKTWER